MQRNRSRAYICVGLARTLYIRCIYGIFGRETTEYTVIYGVYIRFWPTLHMCLNFAQLTLPLHTAHHQLHLQAGQRQGRCSKAYLRVCFCITSHTTQPLQLNLQASQRQGRCSKAYLRVCFCTTSHTTNLTN
jgi:hypothetical protein